MNIEAKQKGIPRGAEICLSLAALALCLPLFIGLAVLIKATSRGTILFRQKRVGRGGREFTLYKFRSMRCGADGLRLTAAGDARLTTFGGWLRRSKLDELPQLWNVLRGEMSLVGPRPEVAEYVRLENPLWREILTVRPGITDPVALRLRNEELLLAAVDDREAFYRQTLQPFKLRGWAQYARQKTLKSDVRILAQTFKVIILPARAHAPTPEELL